MVQAGFNHNIRYKSILFHVQTEDYGQQKHVIVTQLFFGGTIVGKTQTDYSEFVGLEDVSEQINELMKVQHIKMLKDLVSGKIAIPDWIMEKKSLQTEDSKRTLDLDSGPKQGSFEKTVSEFLEKS